MLCRQFVRFDLKSHHLPYLLSNAVAIRDVSLCSTTLRKGLDSFAAVLLNPTHFELVIRRFCTNRESVVLSGQARNRRNGDDAGSRSVTGLPTGDFVPVLHLVN